MLICHSGHSGNTDVIFSVSLIYKLRDFYIRYITLSHICWAVVIVAVISHQILIDHMSHRSDL